MEFMALGRLMVTTRIKGEGYERRNVGVGGGGVASEVRGFEYDILGTYGRVKVRSAAPDEREACS